MQDEQIQQAIDTALQHARRSDLSRTTKAHIAGLCQVLEATAKRLEKAEANQITPTLAEIVGEIHRRAGKEWADEGHDFTVEITADEYARLCKEEEAND